MTQYLVRAVPLAERLPELARRLRAGEFRQMRPFGRALTESLEDARVAPDGRAVWEEEDYCSPPLAQERAAVLDAYFRALAGSSRQPALFTILLSGGQMTSDSRVVRVAAVQAEPVVLG